MDSHTILRRGASLIGVTDLKLGEFVSVSGEMQPDGSVQALIVDVPNFVVQGALTVIDLNRSSLTIDGVTVTLNSTTKFSGVGNPGSAADLKTGDQIGVLGAKLADGTVLATSIIRLGP